MPNLDDSTLDLVQEQQENLDKLGAKISSFPGMSLKEKKVALQNIKNY